MENTKSIYEVNDTMRMIGNQSAAIPAESTKDFYAVMDAHRQAEARDNDLFSIALDFYMLGRIHGRQDTKKEKHNTTGGRTNGTN